MPQRDSHDHALLLLSKSRTDKLVLDKLVDDADIADDAIGFHAQQAVEKLLKAVLANRDVEYPRVHDIDRLIDLLEAPRQLAATPGTPAGRTHAWAAQLRYDELLDMERLDRQRTQQLVDAVLTWAEAELLG